MNEDMVMAWWSDHNPLLERALKQVSSNVQDLCQDWSEAYAIRTSGPAYGRVKDAGRLYDKCIRKNVEDVGELLQAPHPIRDIVGVRLAVRTLLDADQALSVLRQFGEFATLAIDDRSRIASERGYRAIHVDLATEVAWKGTTWAVPCELQIKTMAQAAWGEYTHDRAYSLVSLREDARFAQVAELHRILSDQLAVVDDLVVVVEQRVNDALYEIALRPPTDDTAIPSLVNYVYRRFGEVLRLEDLDRLGAIVAELEVHSITELTEIVDIRLGSGRINDFYQESYGRPPESLLDALTFLLSEMASE